MSAYTFGLFPPLQSSVQASKGDLTCPDEATLSVDIVVTEARIDTLRLVQSLTSTGNAPRSTNQKGSLRLSTGRTNIPMVTEAEAVMLFELKVECDGGVYTVTRSFPDCLQLRQDLVDEYDGGWQPYPAGPATDDWVRPVPEVPRIREGGVLAGPTNSVASSGFSFLQALSRSYAHSLQTWFRQIVRLRNDSSALRRFLREPSMRSSGLSCPLDAIEESEHDCEE